MNLKLGWHYQLSRPSGVGNDLSGVTIATPLWAGHTHQLIACKRACTHLVVVTS